MSELSAALDQITAQILPPSEQLFLGSTVLMANGFPGNRAVDPGVVPIITANYVSPDHELPLPTPKGDAYLRQTFVPAVGPGEVVVCNTLISGLREYYAEVGLLPEDSVILEVEPNSEPADRYGFPRTDPLETLNGQLELVSANGDELYLSSTFNGDSITEQATALGLKTLEGRAPSSSSNHKSKLRESARKYGFDVLPGRTLSVWEDLDEIDGADWNTNGGSWLKFPTGSGGDLVIHIKGEATHEEVESGIQSLRTAVANAFAAGEFKVGFDEFWPADSLAPDNFALLIEADAGVMGEVEANGSTQFVTSKTEEPAIVGHYKQLTTEEGEYLGNEPYADIDEELKRLVEVEMEKVAKYNMQENDYFGIQGVDWFVTRDGSGERHVWVTELNARPTANTPPVIIAQKLDAPHFVNTNVYTNRPIETIDDFYAVVGKTLAHGRPREYGMVVPQAFRTMVTRENIQASPDFKVVILGRDSEHCREIMAELSKPNGGDIRLSFEPPQQ